MYQYPVDADSMRLAQHIDASMADSLPRSQIQRHMSTSSQQRRLSRISKPSSAGNSPQDAHKRRHITSQPISRQRRAYYQQCIQNTQVVETSRPVSWHPSTMAGQQHVMPSTYFSHGIPTPMPLPSPATQFESKGYYNSEDPSGFYQQSADYDVQEARLMQGSSNFNYQQETSAIFSPIVYTSSILPSTYNTHTAPATPDFYSNKTQGTLLPRTDSKELVGMGLYDGPDRNSWTLDSYMECDHTTTRPLSLGKGLKLEETWEPPEDEDKTDDEDDEEEEEEEEQAEETIQEQLEQVARQAPPTDVTNPSYYFNPQDVIPSQTTLIQQMTIASYGMVL